MIPLKIACNLQVIRLSVEITAFNGLKGSANAAASRGTLKPFLPSARPVGPTKLIVPMEIPAPGKEAGGAIHFEITTKAPEYLSNCYTICPVGLYGGEVRRSYSGGRRRAGQCHCSTRRRGTRHTGVQSSRISPVFLRASWQGGGVTMLCEN